MSVERENPKPSLTFQFLQNELCLQATCLDFGIESLSLSKEEAVKELHLTILGHCQFLVTNYETGKLPHADPERVDLARKVLAHGYRWENI